MLQRRRKGGAGVVPLFVTIVALLSGAAAASPTVVVNEVAWGGTMAGSQDEWIELRNCTASPIDLTGWVLAIGDVRIPLAVVEQDTIEVRRSTIEAGGFLLLERTDDTTVSDVEADILYKGSLSNSGADLRLIDPLGNVVDLVACAAAGWPAGCASQGDLPFGTMERVDPIEMGGAWRTNDGLVCCGLDAGGGPLAGTPRAANSATVSYLKAPRIQILGPVAGETSCPVMIQWQAVDPDGLASGLRVTVSVRAVGIEEWTILGDGVPNQGSYLWDCSSFPTDVVYEVLVSARDVDARVGTATSGAFTLR